MKGAVTASSQEAADAGLAILGTGGNAVDAAVAAALATCVADPSNTGIAGYGGYLLVQRAGEESARCVQFPLCAPSTMPPAVLARTYPEAGPECSSVPNVVGGLARALREFGRFSWADVSGPAIALARDGVAANPPTERALELHRHRTFISECFEFEESGAAGGPRLFFRQPALAATLERMAEEGPEWFYRGPLAMAAHRAWRDAGVDIPLEDWLHQAEAVDVVDAPILETNGVRVHAAPLGLSGSACLFAMVAAAARISEQRPLRSARGLADFASAMSSIWQYRFSMPGGNDFEGIDMRNWIDAALAHRASARSSADVGHTAHLNAVDGEGTVAALTLTHGPAHFGGRWAIPGTGVIMNGGMHNFTRPAVVRRHGRWFGISNMTPAIAVNGAGDRIAVGCPGARRIPSNIAMVLTRHLFGGQDLNAAVAGGRFHAEDDTLVHGEGDRLEAGAVEALRGRFARFEPETGDNYFGPLTAIRRAVSGDIEMAVDDRRFKGFGARA